MSEAEAAALQSNLTRGRTAAPKRKATPEETPSERQEQIALARYLDGDPFFAGRWFHVPNGEARSNITGALLKSMGVKRGVPDVWILAPLEVDGFTRPGVVVELKRLRGGRVAPEQTHWLEVARASGFVAVVEHGASAAIDRIRSLYGRR